MAVAALFLAGCGKTLPLWDCERDADCGSHQYCSGGFCLDEEEDDDEKNDEPGPCPEGLTLCDDQCVDISTDMDHCGGCNLICFSTEGVCEDGYCAPPPPCPGTEMHCGGVCVDPMNDPQNCGVCGIECGDGEVCEFGECVMETIPFCDPGEAPFGGGDGTSDRPYTICTPDHLRAVDDYLDAHFELADDIDMRGEPFEVLADYTGSFGQWEDVFTGHFDGANFEISELIIDSPDENAVGLFGVSDGGEIRNLSLRDAFITGDRYVGGLVGINDGTITKVTIDAVVTGSERVGGVAGYSESTSSIVDASVEGQVYGSDYVGGVVGENLGTVENCQGESTVDGASEVGGLVGRNVGVISQSYADGGVDGSFRVGGLVGENRGEVEQSFATGDVNNSGNSSGGLVGRVHPNGEVRDSYARGEVSGIYAVGGLVGAVVVSGGFGPGGDQNSGEVYRSFSTGVVNSQAGGPQQGGEGGLVGLNQAPDPGDNVFDSYWNVDSSGMQDSAGGVGLNDEQFEEQDNFEGFDFEGLWQMGSDAPILSWE